MRLNEYKRARSFGLFGFAVISVWLTVAIGISFFHCFESTRWPKVNARIVFSGVTSSDTNLGTTWTPDVEYEYQVHGSTYRSTTISYLMPVFYQRGRAENIRAMFAKDRQVVTAYDPQDARRSVLETGVPSGMWKQALIPVFFWALLGYVLYEMKYPRRQLLLRSNAGLQTPEPDAG